MASCTLISVTLLVRNSGFESAIHIKTIKYIESQRADLYASYILVFK